MSKSTRLNKLTRTKQLLCVYGVVPLAMILISELLQGRQFLVGDFRSSWIAMAVLSSRDRQALIGRGMGNQFQHHCQRSKRIGTPIDGDEGKEAVLDLVPFTGRRRIMRHGDGDVCVSRQFLQFLHPQPISDPVGAASICRDQQVLLAWIERFAPLLPPSSDTLHGKFGGVVIDADIDKPTVVNQIVDSVRDGFDIC